MASRNGRQRVKLSLETPLTLPKFVLSSTFREKALLGLRLLSQDEKKQDPSRSGDAVILPPPPFFFFRKGLPLSLCFSFLTSKIPSSHKHQHHSIPQGQKKVLLSLLPSSSPSLSFPLSLSPSSNLHKKKRKSIPSKHMRRGPKPTTSNKQIKLTLSSRSSLIVCRFCGWCCPAVRGFDVYIRWQIEPPPPPKIRFGGGGGSCSSFGSLSPPPPSLSFPLKGGELGWWNHRWFFR